MAHAKDGKMMGTLKDTAGDLAMIGHVGIVRALVGVIVVLGGLLVYQQFNFADRWTGSAQALYVKDHDEYVKELIAGNEEYKGDHKDEHAHTMEKINTSLREIGERLARMEARQNGGGSK